MKRYSIATVVLGGDAYIGAALVLAASLRHHCDLSDIDLVVMVTPDIPEQARDALKLQYGL